MKNFLFWQKWLFAVGLLLAAFGLALAFFNQTPLFDYLFNAPINPVFHFYENATTWSQDEMMFQQWIYGVLGATISGWGICVAFVARYPFRKKERWAWNALALGITVWFITDTLLSLAFHVYFNAAFNVVVFLAVALPLAFSQKFFFQE